MVDWLNTNSAAVQAASTVVLVLITAWYAWRTHRMASIGEEQLRIVRKAAEPDLFIELSPVLVPVAVGRVVSGFSFSAGNRGQQPVTVNTPYIALPGKRSFVFPGGFPITDSSFPRRLEPGDGCKAIVETRQMVQALVDAGFTDRARIRFGFHDSVGRKYESEPFDFDVQLWARRAMET